MGNFGSQEILALFPIIVIIVVFFIFLTHTPTGKYDTFEPRFLGGVVDGLVFLPLSFLASIIQNNAATPIIIIWYFFLTFSRPAYIIWMHGKFGQTLGKMATGVIVLNVNENRIINYREAFLREFPYLIMLIIYFALTVPHFLNPDYTIDQPLLLPLYIILQFAQLIWFLLEIITMFSNEKRRAIHDYLAKSVVIRKKEFIPDLNETS